jgi:serine protease
MSLRHPSRISRRFAVLAVAAGATAATALPTVGTGASASTLGGLVKQVHAYRHGLVPYLGVPLPIVGNLNNLSYGGGTNGVGVTTGAPKVYLVFWGSQWGAQGTDSNGNTTLSGDQSRTAPLLQSFFKGLGSSTDTWSKVMTQYCEGVSSGTQTCPTSAPHVGYPTGGALAGVWVDESTAAPSQATQTQLGQEAVAAAAHFGKTAPGSNRNTQYVILSPSGTHPDGFNTASSTWCAWHDWTGDVSVSDPSGGLAFTNMPYVTDAGSNCGTNFVNSGSNGITDGVTIVEGHEYAETITDQFPAGGWTDFTGQENGDKCAWISPGQQGGATNITLSTGSFAVQATWANDYNGGAGGCETSHS